MRVMMIRCVGKEPQPPTDQAEFEKWCESGNSGRPVQTHVGDEGEVLWVNRDRSVCVRFYDADQRLLFPEEVEVSGMSNGQLF